VKTNGSDTPVLPELTKMGTKIEAETEEGGLLLRPSEIRNRRITTQRRKKAEKSVDIEGHG